MKRILGDLPLTLATKPIYACIPAANTHNLEGSYIPRENVLELKPEHLFLIKAYESLCVEEREIILDFTKTRAEKELANKRTKNTPRLRLIKSALKSTRGRVTNNGNLSQ